MKTISAILVAVAATLALTSLTSCEDKKSQKLDPNAKVYINAAQGVKAADDQQRLTARQVVQQAQRIITHFWDMGVDDWNRDTINNRILGGSTWVIKQMGELETDFITSRDVILTTVTHEFNPKDTIAYIENAVMIEAEKQIRAAYAAGDYQACYRLFEDALVFRPITGAEWLELKAQGKN